LNENKAETVEMNDESLITLDDVINAPVPETSKPSN